MIRKMTIEDIEQIQMLDQKVSDIQYPRRKEGLKAYIEKSKNASLVYEENGKILAFIFHHIWGEFAWFGFFAVDPEHQGRGIGKALIKETIKILKEEFKVKNIGLVTMPENPYNVGFYMSMGFSPLTLSLGMIKDIQQEKLLPLSKEYEVQRIDLGAEEEYLKFKKEAAALSNEIYEGLDLSSQLEMIRNKDFGFVLELKKSGKLRGFAICHTKHIREMETDLMQVRELCVSPEVDSIEGIEALLQQAIYYGQKEGFKSIYIDCNTAHEELCKYFIVDRKFKVSKTQLSLMMGNKKFLEEYKGVLLCRWSG